MTERQFQWRLPANFDPKQTEVTMRYEHHAGDETGDDPEMIMNIRYDILLPHPFLSGATMELTVAANRCDPPWGAITKACLDDAEARKD